MESAGLVLYEEPIEEFRRPYCLDQGLEISWTFKRYFPYTILRHTKLWPVRSLKAAVDEATPDEKRANRKESFYKVWERQELLHRKKLLVIEFRRLYWTQRNAERMFKKKVQQLEESYPKQFPKYYNEFRRRKNPDRKYKQSNVHICDFPFCSFRKNSK